MNRNHLLLCAFLVAGAAQAQFDYVVSGTPDSAQVTFNGRPKCTTPCRARYSWSDAVDKRIAVEITAPGYEPWRDTLWRKPQNYEQFVSVNLKRSPLSPPLDSTSAIVAFDRLLINLKAGDRIGTHTDKHGDKLPINWDPSTQVGERTVERRFYESVMQAGVRVPGKQAEKLFAKPTDQRVQTPRYLVGGKVTDLKVSIAYQRDRQNSRNDGDRGRSEMRIEWQVMDRSSSKVVLTGTSTGYSTSSDRTIYGADNQIDAFEDALWAFLRAGEFTELLRNAGPETGGGVAADSTIAATPVSKAVNPPFKTLGEMIKHADRACVTVITDEGHGSGVIIDAEGYALSAYHVVQDAKRIEVQFSDGLKQEARVLVHDMGNDLVLLDITGSGFRALPMGKDEDNGMGDEVITIGTPADLQLGQSVSKGILSGKRKIEEKVYLQTDLAVSPGNSGGPLLNAKGEVIGIIQGKLVGKGIEGLGFAVPVERVQELLRIQVNP